MTLEVIAGTQSELERALIDDFQTAARAAIATRGSFRIVLAGGSIGPLFFPALARLALDWTRVDFFWADERAVPADDSESNFAEANRWWLTPAKVPAERIHRMAADGRDLQAAADNYAAELRRVAGDPPALDFALLGVGPDGHIASLFPGHRALEEKTRLVVPVEDAPKPPPRRITLTLPTLAGAARIIVAAQGPAKEEAIRRSAEPGSPLPLGRLIARSRNVRVLLLK
jgi:6-phosphogluconolactonase